MATDGRRLRREQNREAVVDALLGLFRDGNYQPSAVEVAARSGLSLRSLFRYFDDVDDLHRAAAARQIALALPLLEPGIGPDAPTLDKIRAVVRARVRLFEEIGPSARALRACAHRHKPLAAELARNRAFFRRQLAVLFAPEAVLSAPEAVLSAPEAVLSAPEAVLSAPEAVLSAPEAAGSAAPFLPVFDVLCSFESYELLRTDQGLSRARSEAVLTEALAAVAGLRQEVLR
jgi:AcrR family transcriptional regulator